MLFEWTSTPGPNFKQDNTNETVFADLRIPKGSHGVSFAFTLKDAGNDRWWAIDNLRLVRLVPME